MATAEEQRNLDDFRAMRDRILGAIPQGSHNGTKARLLTSSDGGYITEQIAKTYTKADGSWTNSQIAKLEATVGKLAGAVAAIAGGGTFDQAKLVESIRSATAEANEAAFAQLAETVRSELAATISDGVLKAIDAADIDEQVREGLVSAVKSITTTTVVDVAGEVN